jgi:hypothetical protein
MNERKANSNCFSKTEALYDCVSKKNFYSECKPQVVHLMSCLNKNVNPKEFAQIHQNYTKNYQNLDDAQKNNFQTNIQNPCFKFKSMVDLCESNKL